MLSGSKNTIRKESALIECKSSPEGTFRFHGSCPYSEQQRRFLPRRRRRRGALSNGDGSQQKGGEETDCGVFPCLPPSVLGGGTCICMRSYDLARMPDGKKKREREEKGGGGGGISELKGAQKYPSLLLQAEREEESQGQSQN